MLNFLKFSLLFYLTIWLSGCSLFFGKTISETDLRRNHTLAIYQTGIDFKHLARELNDRGEAVVIGRFEDIQVYLQIFATGKELIVKKYETYEYDFGKFDIYEGD